MALCAASQPLRLGAAFTAAIASLSHLARVGLAVHVASPWMMPGWDGHLTLELLNAGPATLRLHRDMPAARAVIWRMGGTTGDPVPHAAAAAVPPLRRRVRIWTISAIALRSVPPGSCR